MTTEYDDDHEPDRLGQLLRDRVLDLSPDMAARAITAVRLGRRRRRRRQMTIATTGIAGVAAVGVVALQLASPGSTPAPDNGIQVAAGASPRPSASAAKSPARSKHSTARSPQVLPVSFSAPGWTCDPPADDKFICTAGAATVQVIARPARFHHDYLASPDKMAPGQYVSRVHHGVFVTVEANGTSASADSLAQYLVWK